MGLRISSANGAAAVVVVALLAGCMDENGGSTSGSPSGGIVQFTDFLGDTCYRDTRLANRATLPNGITVGNEFCDVNYDLYRAGLRDGTLDRRARGAPIANDTERTEYLALARTMTAAYERGDFTQALRAYRALTSMEAAWAQGRSGFSTEAPSENRNRPGAYPDARIVASSTSCIRTTANTRETAVFGTVTTSWSIENTCNYSVSFYYCYSRSVRGSRVTCNTTPENIIMSEGSYFTQSTVIPANTTTGLGGSGIDGPVARPISFGACRNERDHVIRHYNDGSYECIVI